MAPRTSVSMDTIAKHFGVSKVTVSKALNDKEGVSEELRKTIKDKALELGYHINVAARALKNNKTSNVGILIADRFLQGTNTYYLEVSAKLVKALANYGYSGIMEVLDHDKENKKILPNIYLENKIDAIIILGECNKEYLKLFDGFNIPVVFFDFNVDDINIDSIVVDNYASGQQITKLLIDNGHKKIGFIGNIYSTSSIKDRFMGYYRALLEANLTLDYHYVISDRDETGELIDVTLPTDGLEMPTALVCNNDQLAYQVIKKLHELGYQVPNDISVVAFDNTIYSKLSSVEITTVDTNVDQMVEICAKVINKKLLNPGKVYDRILVKGTIIERKSVRKI